MKGYRTIIIAVLTIVSGVLAQTDWNVFYDHPSSGLVAIATGVVMVICRLVTTTPVFDSKHPAEVVIEKVKKVDPDIIDEVKKV